MKKAIRIAGALLAAALAATSVFIIGNTIRFGATDIYEATAVAAVVLLVAGCLSFSVGFAAYLLFQFFGWRQLRIYVIAGAGIGLLGGYLLGLLFAEVGVGGAAGGAVFWAIAVRATSRTPATPV